MKKTLLSLLTATLLFTASATVLSANQSPKVSKPFLIQGKLPHLTIMVKKLWNDRDLALTKAQKKRLLVVRKDTLTAVKSLKIKIMKLENEVVTESNNGTKPASLKNMLKKIASLRVEATMVHLKCIYNTRKILSKEQLDILE
jgi:hypothetical protein